MRAYEAHTEADPAAILVNVLTEFGAMVGGMAEGTGGRGETLTLALRRACGSHLPLP